MKKIFFLVLLLLDTLYSFHQHYHAPLEGDMARVIVPAEGFEKMMCDPLGIEAAVQHTSYAAPNRFFAHWAMYAYFRTVPFGFQWFTSPIDSIYWSCALAKTLIQLFILFLLAMYCCVEDLKKETILLVAVLLMPLFQTAGYNGLMGIIEGSITYTFFYALPTGLLLLFFFPFYRALYTQQAIRFTPLTMLVALFFMVVLALNGPLLPGVVLILFFLFCMAQLKKKHDFLSKKTFSSLYNSEKMPLFCCFFVFALFCLYSLYIGQYNIENSSSFLSLQERYARIPMGLVGMFTEKLGYPVLTLMLVVNTRILAKNPIASASSRFPSFIQLLRWAAWFALLYLLLLPFGGYRVYRPNIVRRDSIQPILIALFFLYGLSSFLVLKHPFFRYKKQYALLLGLICLIFTVADEPVLYANQAERAALEQIAASPDPIVALDTDATIMAWGKITDFNASSINTKLLSYWGVLKTEKLYYQK
jgi:hypothetical protein